MILAGLAGLPSAWSQPAAPAGELAQLRTRAEHEDLEAQNALGNAYTNAQFGVKVDFPEAYRWYKQAADKGYAPAQFNLGLVYELGRGLPADERQAFKYYLMSAEQGFAAAQFNVGNMYSAGRGIGQDLFEANLWYKQAAEKGILEAQFNLGLAYEAGRGVKKDEVQATRWYKQAADRGFARAQYNLGLLLEDGRGVRKDETMAATLYRAAAEQGFAPAQNNYGVMISEGRGGLAKDPVEAYAWLSLSAENGASPAARDFIARSLSPEQLAAGARLAADRKAGKFPPAAVAVTAPARAEPAPAPTAAGPDNSTAANRVAELTAALEKARDANTQFAETNQRLEVDRAKLQQELSQGSESGKLIAQLRDQSRRLSEQVQTLNADKASAERDAALAATQLQDAREELARQKAAGAPPPTGGAAPADLTKARGEIATLTAKLAQTAAATGQLQQANQQLADTNARLQGEKDKLAAAANTGPAIAGPDGDRHPVQNSDKDAMLANLQRDNTRLNDEVKRSTRELLSLNAQLRQLRSRAAKPSATGAGDNTVSAEVRAENQRVDTNNTRLQNQRDAATSDAETLTAELRDSREEIAKLNRDLQLLRSTRQSPDAASAQLAELTSKTHLAEQATTRLEAENARLTARMAELEKTPAQPAADASAPQLAKARQAAAQLEQQVRALEDEKTSLNRALSEKTAAAQEAGRLQTENTRLVGRVAELEQRPNPAVDDILPAKLAQAQQTAAQLQEQLQKLQTEKADLEKWSQSLEKTINEKTATTRTSDTATAGLRQSLADAQQQLGDRTAALATAEQNLQKLTAENQAFAERVAQAEKAATAKVPDRSATAELGAARQQIAELQDRSERLTHENQNLIDKMSAEHSTYLQSQARVASLESDLRATPKQPAVSPAALDDLKKQLAEANQALDKSGATVAELTAANDRLEKEAGAARQTASNVAALRAELAGLKADAPGIAALREENVALRRAGAEVSDLRAKNDQLARDNEQVTGFMAANRRDLDQAQAKLADLGKQLEEARATRTRGGDDTKKLQADLADANQSVEKLNATVAELTGANDRLEKDLDNAKKATAAALAAQSEAVTAARPDAYKMEIGTLQAHVKELEGQIEEERNSSAKEVSTLAAQLSRTRETNKSLTEANRALLNAKQADTPTVDKDQFDQLQAKVNNLTAALADANQQSDKLGSENARLTSEQDALKRQVDEARKAATSASSLAGEKSALQERLEAVGAQLVKAQQEIDTLQKDNADATSQSLASKQAADKAQADLAALQGRASEAEKASESHNAAVAELTEANTKLETDRADLRRQLAALKADNLRLTQTAGSAEQLKAEADRSAQQNIDALTAQLNAARRDLQSAREANSRLVEGNVNSERDRAATLAQLRNENAALAGRLTQAQGTLDQIASAARLGTPASSIASGNPAPILVVSTAQPASIRFHTVGEGDSLSRISMRYYGTPNRWQEIYNANRDVLQGSSVLRVGMQLRIP
ncbi:MAG: hcpC [Lacunisphaera sp.]|nr:hcpC [Lacunisphaera sp.]